MRATMPIVLVLLVMLAPGCGVQTPRAEAEKTSSQSERSASPPATLALERVDTMVDGPYYEDVEALAEEADALLAVTVLNSRTELDRPDFSSDNPLLNPYVGSGESPSPEDIDAMGVVMTVYTVRVDEAHAGDVEVGSSIELMELGGIHENVDHRVHEMSRLSDQSDDLLFVSRLDNGRYETVGMDQGRMEADGQGGYRSIDADRTDLVIESSTELTELKSQTPS